MNNLSQKMAIAVTSTVTGKEIKTFVILIILWRNTQRCAPLPGSLPLGRRKGRKADTAAPVNGAGMCPSLLSAFPYSCRTAGCAIALPSSCRSSSLGCRQALIGAYTRSHPLTLRIHALLIKASFLLQKEGARCEHMGLGRINPFFVFSVLLYLCVGSLRDFQLSSSECSLMQLQQVK